MRIEKSEIPWLRVCLVSFVILIYHGADGKQRLIRKKRINWLNKQLARGKVVGDGGWLCARV